MNRDRGYYRKERIKHIQRKKRICDEVWNDGDTYFKFDGQYSKGKIHCSCSLCAAKTRVNGYKISDQRKQDRMTYQEKEIA